MQLMLLMPRIDSVLEVGTNEAIRSIQVKQVNSSVSLSVKSIPNLIPDTPAEDSGIPSKSGQEVRQEFSCASGCRHAVSESLKKLRGHHARPRICNRHACGRASSQLVMVICQHILMMEAFI